MKQTYYLYRYKVSTILKITIETNRNFNNELHKEQMHTTRIVLLVFEFAFRDTRGYSKFPSTYFFQ